jgi:lipid-A-disaccharide synthase
MNNNILIIAGEPSGDIRGGELLSELKGLLPETSFWGIGGDRMKDEGVELIEHVQNLSIVGVWEAIKDLSRIREQYKQVAENVKKRKPSLAILIDYPGFNLKIASFLHREKIPVVYYIIPQVWAWGQSRVKSIKKNIDKVLVLFNFEKEFLARFGINAEFVGHPLLESVPEKTEKKEDPSSLSIALLPGSRESEIKNLLPVMAGAAERISRYKEDVSFIVAENSNIDSSLYDSILSKYEKLHLTRIKDNTFEALSKSDFAVVTSGTATLETAVMEKPMVITYRTSFLTATLFRLFVRAPYIGLANIVAGKEVAPEILQEDATPENLSKKVLEMINDEQEMLNIKGELRKVKEALGEKGAAKKAANAINQYIEKKDLLA